MPYSPADHFDPGLIFRGITGAGEGIASGIQDMQKKRQEAEAQAAGAMIQFQTLKQANLLTPEEETAFHSGNANKKSAIVTSATPRLMQKLRLVSEARQAQEHQLNRENAMKVAMLHYGPDNGDGSGMTPYQREQTRLRALDIQRKANKSSIPQYSRAIARGKLDAKGEFDNNYAEAATGEMAQIKTPDGKTIVVPWDAYVRSQNPEQSSPSAPQAASGAAPVTPAPQDQQALVWAKANPSDPRAAAILKKLGLQ